MKIPFFGSPKGAEVSLFPTDRANINSLIHNGLIEVGKDVKIVEGAVICHPNRKGERKKVKIGDNVMIMSGAIIYGDVEIGDNCFIGHQASIREGCRIGNNTQIGAKVAVECYTNIGNNVSIETQSHITGWMTIEDYVFIGGFVGSTNDFYMNYKRSRHGQNLNGATVKYGARVGSGAILMPNITIGRYAVINAGEVVRKDVPDNCLMFTKKGQVLYKPIRGEKVSGDVQEV